MARDLQASLLPRETPELAGWDFAAYWQPARQVSGDFYDFIPTEQGVGVVIADVSDKGMPAALFMALSRTIVRASLIQSDSPAEGMKRANRLICADSPNSMFVTLFGAQIAANGDLIYVNAGHNPPYLYRAAVDQPLRLARTSMALGIDDTLHFEQHTAHLDPGDALILYTDGIPDALNARGEEFGDARLRLAEAARVAFFDYLLAALILSTGIAAPSQTAAEGRIALFGEKNEQSRKSRPGS